MKTALYHQATGPATLDVLATHADGTVDLGRGETVLVARCRVVDKPVVGSATLVSDKAAADKAAADKAATKPAPGA